MEWVETTGKTVEAAKDAALDQLGVAEEDAEFEVLEEPRRGLFGLLGADARVRARVRPAIPRSKERRSQRQRRNKRGGRGETSGDDVKAGSEDSAGGDRPTRDRGRRPARRSGAGAAQSAPTAAAPVRTGGGTRDAREQQAVQQPQEARMPSDVTEDDPSVEEQADLARTFLEGLVEAFGVPATVSARVVDDDTIDLDVHGEDLGLLIGPRAQTLSAVQELVRTVVQRRVVGHYARIHVDVAGYRERRRGALERFTRQVVDQVLEAGESRALEPMNAADRKVVHDTVNAIEGVGTRSEGEEPRRRVVIVPEAAGD